MTVSAFAGSVDELRCRRISEVIEVTDNPSLEEENHMLFGEFLFMRSKVRMWSGQQPPMESFMKDTVGLMLREAWRQNGKPECLHPELSPERSFSGVRTGFNVCTTCGALVACHTEEQPISKRGD